MKEWGQLLGIKWMYKRQYYLYCLSVCMLSCLIHLKSIAQIGAPVIHNYAYTDYQADPQNWGIAQGLRGFVYVANSKGVLQFDGKHWSLIRLPEGKMARSLVLDSTSNRIYVTSVGEFGYLDADANGKRIYISLSQQLPKNFPPINHVWSVHKIQNQIYFVSEKYVFIWDGKQLKYLRCPAGGEYFAAFVVGKALWLNVINHGIMVWENNTLRQLPGSFPYSQSNFCFALKNKQNELIVGNIQHGILKYDGTQFIPLANATTLGFDKYQPYCATFLPNGHLAIGTVGGGIFLCNETGQIINKINTKVGLVDNTVMDIYKGTNNSIWVATLRGVSCITQYPSLSIFNAENGLEGNVTAFLIHKGIIWAGTYDGLYYYEPNSQKFTQLSQLNGSCLGLNACGDSLLVSSSWGLQIIHGTQITNVLQSGVNVAQKSNQYPGRLYIGLHDGFGILENGHFQRIEGLQGFDIRTILELKDGSVWISSLHHGLFLLKDNQVKTFGTKEGLPSLHDNYVYPALQSWTVSTTQGLYAFNPQTQKFTPNEKLYKILASKGLKPGKRGAGTITVQGDSIVWLQTYQENQPSILYYIRTRKNMPGIVLRNYVLAPKFIVNTIGASTDTVWVGGPAGLIRTDFSQKQPSSVVQLHLRKIISGKDSILFEGAKTQLSGKTFSAQDAHSLRFEFAVPIFQDNIEYSHYLAGFDADTSEWSNETHAIYTNLSGGNYELYVRAKDVNGKIYPPLRCAFTVLPPWYWSWWAYSLYVAFAGGLLYTGGLFWLRRVKRRQRLMEEKIQLRTQALTQKQNELTQANQAIDAQRLDIQKVNDELNAQLASLDILNRELNLQKQELKEALDFKSRYSDNLKIAYDEINQQKEQLKQQNIDLIQSKQELQKTIKELTIAQAQLIQSEKMNVLGRLISGIAHELNTPMGAIKAAAENLVKFIPEVSQNLPVLIQSLDDDTRILFHRLVERFMQGADTLSTRQERILRRMTENYLQKLGLDLDLSEDIAKELIKGGFFYKTDEILPYLEQNNADQKVMEVGFFTELAIYLPLLRHPKVEELISMAGIIGRARLGLDNIALAVSKTQKIIFALKSYAYKRSADIPEATDIIKSVEDALLLSHNMLKHGVEVTRKYDMGLANILCNPDELHQVWCNIMDNAVYAMKGSGKLTIEIQKVENFVSVSFTDNGPGISPENINKIFEPFFTTKGKGEGVGLGLDLCKRVIENNNKGKIVVYSEPGHTCFQVLLPYKPAASITTLTT